jgi:hypothetical protein
MRDKRESGRLSCLLLALCISATQTVMAQGLPDVEVDVISSRVYTSAVDAYAAGRHDEGIARLARVVPSAVFETARTAVPGWSAEPSSAERRWRAAAVLHLDTAWRLVQRYRADAVDPHLRVVDLALDRLRAIASSSTPDTETFRALCAIARLHHLTVAGRHDELDRAVSSMRVPAALQVDVLFARGLSHETRARAMPPRVDRRPTRATAPLQSATLAGARRVWLENHLRYAAESYTQVLALDAGADEARLRLSRVQLERGTPDAALETLAPLTTSGCTDDVCAMAWLVRGEALETRGEGEAAGDAYRHALGSPSVRGSATVALLSLDADVPASADAVTPAAAPPSFATQEPTAWRAYLLGITHRHAVVMQTLQESVR